MPVQYIKNVNFMSNYVYKMETRAPPDGVVQKSSTCKINLEDPVPTVIPTVCKNNDECKKAWSNATSTKKKFNAQYLKTCRQNNSAHQGKY